uniref:Amino acid transporter transmembrane domain-containing protein n=1 Tax=Rhinolophus ferrumequinum TaxID=59479 RepID=A0A671F6L3_RHIFE
AKTDIIYIFGFIAASSAAMLIFTLPSVFYIKLVKKEPMKFVQKIGAMFFLFFLKFVQKIGIVVMTGSMALIILDWVHNTHGEGH